MNVKAPGGAGDGKYEQFHISNYVNLWATKEEEEEEIMVPNGGE